MNLVEGLNDRQREAVINTEGPMLILAGAGSGKTKVLTTKVAYLIEEKNVRPENILAITFTNKAAREMKERIYKLVGKDAFYIQISTFHSFGLKILKENYEFLGYRNNFTILDSDDSLSVVKKIMKELNIDSAKYNYKAVRNAISNNKNEMIDPIMFERFVHTDYDEVIKKVYEKYEKTLKINNSIDFDDLLILPLKLFKEYPKVLMEYQNKYKYIFIDEYQDTNEPQYILSKMISAKYRNITVVGDADQAIFTWRGANYKNILNFEKDYSEAKTVLLEENYRSTKTILNAANSVIKHNKIRKEKNLWTQNEAGTKIIYYKAFDEKDESNYVVTQVKKLIEEKNVSPNDICVLYRANAQSRVIEEAFLTSNIAYNIVGSYAFYNRKEIKDLIAYLKLLYNEKDDISLLRIINYPKRGIGNARIENLNIIASAEEKSLYEVIDSGKEFEFKNMIEDIKKEEGHLSLTELIEVVLEKSGMKKSLEDEKTLEADIKLENLEEFKSITKSFEEREGIVSLGEFLDELSLVSDVSEQKNDNNEKVTLMTMHAVKGLEYDYVFIIGFEEGLFPHNNCFESNEELEEERRLCYVAITRAKKKLYLINARSRVLYGRVSSNIPSRFINEIGNEYLEEIGKKDSVIVKDKIDKSKMLNEDNNLQPGDMVNHDKYGFGVVISIDGSIATISFKKDGMKKLMKNHKSIKKI